MEYEGITFADSTFKIIEAAAIEYIRKLEPDYDVSKVIEEILTTEPDSKEMLLEAFRGIYMLDTTPWRSFARKGLVKILKVGIKIYYQERYDKPFAYPPMRNLIFEAWCWKDHIETSEVYTKE